MTLFPQFLGFRIYGSSIFNDKLWRLILFKSKTNTIIAIENIVAEEILGSMIGQTEQLMLYQVINLFLIQFVVVDNVHLL